MKVIIFIWKSLIMKRMCVGSFRPTDCWNKLVCQYLSIFSQIYLFGTLWLMTLYLFSWLTSAMVDLVSVWLLMSWSKGSNGWAIHFISLGNYEFKPIFEAVGECNMLLYAIMINYAVETALQPFSVYCVNISVELGLCSHRLIKKVFDKDLIKMVIRVVNSR